MSLVSFKYLKANEVVPSNRVVFQIHKPNTNMLGIDLTSYDAEDRLSLNTKLEALQREFNIAIADMGLYGNWRQFKKEGITLDE